LWVQIRLEYVNGVIQ